MADIYYESNHTGSEIDAVITAVTQVCDEELDDQIVIIKNGTLSTVNAEEFIESIFENADTTQF